MEQRVVEGVGLCIDGKVIPFGDLGSGGGDRVLLYGAVRKFLIGCQAIALPRYDDACVVCAALHQFIRSAAVLRDGKGHQIPKGNRREGVSAKDARRAHRFTEGGKIEGVTAERGAYCGVIGLTSSVFIHQNEQSVRREVLQNVVGVSLIEEQVLCVVTVDVLTQVDGGGPFRNRSGIGITEKQRDRCADVFDERLAELIGIMAL